MPFYNNLTAPDPLLDPIKKVMQDNQTRRVVEANLNKEWKIESRRALPFEKQPEYARQLAERCNKALNDPKVLKEEMTLFEAPTVQEILWGKKEPEEKKNPEVKTRDFDAAFGKKDFDAAFKDKEPVKSPLADFGSSSSIKNDAPQKSNDAAKGDRQKTTTPADREHQSFDTTLAQKSPPKLRTNRTTDDMKKSALDGIKKRQNDAQVDDAGDREKTATTNIAQKNVPSLKDRRRVPAVDLKAPEPEKKEMPKIGTGERGKRHDRIDTKSWSEKIKQRNIDKMANDNDTRDKDVKKSSALKVDINKGVHNLDYEFQFNKKDDGDAKARGGRTPEEFAAFNAAFAAARKAGKTSFKHTDGKTYEVKISKSPAKKSSGGSSTPSGVKTNFMWKEETELQEDYTHVVTAKNAKTKAPYRREFTNEKQALAHANDLRGKGSHHNVVVKSDRPSDRDVNEEQINELSKATLSSYADKATKDKNAMKNTRERNTTNVYLKKAMGTYKPKDTDNWKAADKTLGRKINNRYKGIEKAKSKIDETVEALAEMSKEKLAAYASKATKKGNEKIKSSSTGEVNQGISNLRGAELAKKKIAGHIVGSKKVKVPAS